MNVFFLFTGFTFVLNEITLSSQFTYFLHPVSELIYYIHIWEHIGLHKLILLCHRKLFNVVLYFHSLSYNTFYFSYVSDFNFNFYFFSGRIWNYNTFLIKLNRQILGWISFVIVFFSVKFTLSEIFHLFLDNGSSVLILHRARGPSFRFFPKKWTDQTRR